mmetsp:Transcript_22213/g.34888  ORF Transcript_22213/g.34888 Transcript_22213/m.34888 type:complete len:151 (+) Transcript_22213:34-486(+)
MEFNTGSSAAKSLDLNAKIKSDPYHTPAATQEQPVTAKVKGDPYPTIAPGQQSATTKDEHPISENRRISIYVIDQRENRQQMTVRENTLWKKIFKTYATAKNIDLGRIRFFIDGARIDQEKTPKLTQVEDGDEIEVFQEMEGGRCWPDAV